jgi:hypothetical protein
MYFIRRFYPSPITITASLPNNDELVRSLSSKTTVTITFVDPSGEEKAAEAELGKHLLDVAHDNNIELEGE